MGVKHYLWRAVDHEGEVLESFVTKRRDKKAALNRRSAKRNSSGNPSVDMVLSTRSSRIALLHTTRHSKAWARSTKERLAGGSTTALRIPTSHSDDGSGPCSGSEGCEPEVRAANFARIRRSPRLGSQPIRLSGSTFMELAFPGPVLCGELSLC